MRHYARPLILPRLPCFLMTPLAARTAAPSDLPRSNMLFATCRHRLFCFEVLAFFVCLEASLSLSHGIKNKRPASLFDSQAKFFAVPKLPRAKLSGPSN